MKTIIKTHGTVKFIWKNGAKVQTLLGEVYVPAWQLDDRFVFGARVALEVTKSEKDGGKRAAFVAEKILGVLPAVVVEPVVCYARVKWFNGKDRYGYVTLIDHPDGGDARLHGNACPGLKPQKNDYLRVMVEETMKGMSVISLEFGSHISAAAKAIERNVMQQVKEPASRIIGGSDGLLHATAAVIPVFNEEL